jgi:tetratricopeptide (TPR) repeat protein
VTRLRGGRSRLEQALEHVERAIAVKPNLGRSHLEKGRVLAALGRSDEARRAVERARALDPLLARRTASTVVATAPGVATEDGARSIDCRPVEGVDALPLDRMLLFGELHGTDRGPEAFGRVACHAARGAGSVVVAVEISHREQAPLDAYLESDGAQADRERLLAGDWWVDDYQDGRRTQAMVELVERLRRLRRSGVEVSVVAFDPLPDVPLAEREEHLAHRLAEARARHPKAPVLALAGNLHPRTQRGTPWDAAFLPMGARLAAAGVAVLPIDIRHAGGTAWTCTGASAASCGPRDVGGAGPPRDVPALELLATPEEDTGYAGALWIGAVEASPPAASERQRSPR